MTSAVLDASAFLAYVRREPGAPVVREAIGRGAAMSAVNWAEILSKLADGGEDPEEAEARFVREGLVGDGITVISLASADALAIARLRPLTRSHGLSLGDRACLALGQRLSLPVLTADRRWQALPVGVEVRVIR